METSIAPQLITACATLAGVILTLVATEIRERRQAAGEREAAARAERKGLYVELLRAAQEVRQNVDRLTEDPNSQYGEVQQMLFDRVERSIVSASSAYQQLLILQGQDPDTSKAARLLLRHIDDFELVREATEHRPGSTWEELAGRARRPARTLQSRLKAWQDDFVLLAKADLGGT